MDRPNSTVLLAVFVAAVGLLYWNLARQDYTTESPDWEDIATADPPAPPKPVEFQPGLNPDRTRMGAPNQGATDKYGFNKPCNPLERLNTKIMEVPHDEHYGAVRLVTPYLKAKPFDDHANAADRAPLPQGVGILTGQAVDGHVHPEEQRTRSNYMRELYRVTTRAPWYNGALKDHPARPETVLNNREDAREGVRPPMAFYTHNPDRVNPEKVVYERRGIKTHDFSQIKGLANTAIPKMPYNPVAEPTLPTSFNVKRR